MLVFYQKNFANESATFKAANPNAIQTNVPKGQLGTSMVATQTRSKEQIAASAKKFQDLKNQGANKQLNEALGTTMFDSKKATNAVFKNQANTVSNNNFKNGMNSATVNRTTIANTWNNMGTAGKIATGAAVIGGTALMAKGIKSLFKKKKDED